MNMGSFNRKKSLLAIYALVFSSFGCFSQELMENLNDAYKIKKHEGDFINKPLKILLREIKPPIKFVSGNSCNNCLERTGYFTFRFESKKQLDTLKTKGITPVTIVVYVKEAFEWEIGQRPKGKETNWTANDVNKFGDLTITGLRVYGDTTASR